MTFQRQARRTHLLLLGSLLFFFLLFSFVLFGHLFFVLFGTDGFGSGCPSASLVFWLILWRCQWLQWALALELLCSCFLLGDVLALLLVLFTCAVRRAGYWCGGSCFGSLGLFVQRLDDRCHPHCHPQSSADRQLSCGGKSHHFGVGAVHWHGA